MDDYFHRRELLIHQDKARRVDSRRADNLSQLELQADMIVRDIRTAEAISVWGVEQDSRGDEDPTHMFPGMAFLTARDIILRTNLFRIMSKMPKGALLHAHLDATVNAEILLKLALNQPYLYVRTTGRLTEANISTLLPEFTALRTAHTNGVVPSSVTDASYSHGVWLPIQSARESFDSTLGGPLAFDKWVIGTLTVSPAEAYQTHNTTTKIWRKFQSTFLVSHPLIYHAPIWKEYIHQFLISSIEDGISYVEVRINFFERFMTGADGIKNVPHREWLLVFDRVLNEVKQNLKQEGRDDEFVGCKIIYSTLRFVSSEELEWYLEDCIALKQEFPHLIVGFDLVGHEDSLKPLIDYIEPLTNFIERTKELSLDIPFIFHAGETLGDGTTADMNLYDAILLGTKRIGHGFSLIKHPKLMEICRERGIAVETCPISNEILRLTTSMPMHPLPALINHGVPVTLCSDDPAVFGNMGLSFDFFQVLVASEVTGLVTLGELAVDSIKYSCLNNEEKEQALAKWERQWYEFLSWIVAEHQSHEVSKLGDTLSQPKT